jgi:hypothetical protein
MLSPVHWNLQSTAEWNCRRYKEMERPHIFTDLNIVKMAKLPKMVYRFSIIPTEFSNPLFTEIENQS